MNQIIGDFTQAVREKSASRLSVRRPHSNSPHSLTPSPTLITSIEG
jgi:hypothetical protein